MASEEERQAKAQESIAQSLKSFVKIFAAFNKNLVDFTRKLEESKITDLGEPSALTKEVIEEFQKKDPNKCEDCDLLYCPVLGCNSNIQAQQRKLCGCTTAIEHARHLGSVRRPQEWMNHLHRYWNYTADDDFEELNMSEIEFLQYMARQGTEVTDQIPKEKR